MRRAGIRWFVVGCAALGLSASAAVPLFAEEGMPPPPPPVTDPPAIAAPAASPPAQPTLPPQPTAPAAAAKAPALPAASPGSAAAPSGGAPSATAPGTPVPIPNVPAKPKKIVKVAPPSEFALPSDPTPTLQPATFFTTAKASERYAAINDAGGWPTLPDRVRLGPGSKGSLVAALRLRLSIEGDLTAGAPDDVQWDPVLTQAVKHYQQRLGLRPTGIVAGATLKALNVPAEVRLKQLAASARRLAALNFSFDDRYVVVNIPSTSVEEVENGTVVRRYVAIVGDPDHPSPEVSAKITAVNLNPTWTVPVSIIKNEIIPRMQRDPGYLSREKIRILDGKGKEINPASIDWTSDKAANYILRQDSGTGNSLGAIRINMPNNFAVYMHDTPSKRLFSKDYRFLSHGCVRVSGVYDLAEWLLRGADGDWTVAMMKAAVATGEHKEIKLAKPTPVIWVYLTGWADADGTVHFRDDVYGIDSVADDGQQAAVDPQR